VTLLRAHRRVFDGLALDLREARVGVIGDNGAGKSSLFRLICGLDLPSQGQVVVHGIDTRADRRGMTGKVGLMFQNPDDQIVFPTVVEELAFSLYARGEARIEARKQARSFLAGCGLATWAERSISELSQGQRQHVCLLALLISNPAVLLLDEPFASLDRVSQAQLSAHLASRDQQLIVSTHSLEHVQSFERVIWLERGSVRADGRGRDVCEAYSVDVRSRAATGWGPTYPNVESRE
ncbi:MAG: ABC transporter ATP-binding protein, partial [Proteobacteria bacterium]|nr:ABC transporter ATP-binding protein [Pseudomonadota bacterium]